MDTGWYETAFRTLDPLADETPDVSPYAFVNNNPISLIDLLGLQDTLPNAGGDVNVTDRLPSPYFDPTYTGAGYFHYSQYDFVNQLIGGKLYTGYTTPLKDVSVTNKAKPKPKVRITWWNTSWNYLKNRNWRGITSAGIGFASGLLEAGLTGVGDDVTGGLAIPLTSAATADGYSRMVLNGGRFLDYFASDGTLADGTPSNLGGVVGKAGDMPIGGKSYSQVGIGQTLGSVTNDFGSFILTGGTSDATRYLISNPTNMTNWYNYGISNFGYNISTSTKS